MIKVITYGTYDMLHYGHIKLLERAKALGDYLIVGVTSDDYDRTRGKINLQQSLIERIDAVKATGIPDEVIVEEYEGQKIDDIQRYDIDIFTVGSDWEGMFDYLGAYCKVIYLPRTEGISSSALRAQQREIRLGFVCEEEERILFKFIEETGCVNGLSVSGVCTSSPQLTDMIRERVPFVTDDYDKLLAESDAVYLLSHPSLHYRQIRQAIEAGRHVLVETPIAIDPDACRALFEMADKRGVVLMESIKTAYATAYSRLLLLVKSGRIGRVVSVDATCTSIREIAPAQDLSHIWNSICAWGPTAILPVLQILGTDYRDVAIRSLYLDRDKQFDIFSRIDLTYPGAVATAKVGRGVKSEGELVISGTKGYIYVPAPWWKTDYFELRYEQAQDNRRYYYPLEGEGIRYELAAFTKAASMASHGSLPMQGGHTYISRDVSVAISEIINRFYANEVREII